MLACLASHCLVSLQVAVLLEWWMTEAGLAMDVLATPALEGLVSEFVATAFARRGLGDESVRLLALWDHVRTGEWRREIAFVNNPAPAAPEVEVGHYLFSDLSPLEIARQLTRVESDLYHDVPPYELTKTRWGDDDLKATCPALNELFLHFNAVVRSGWRWVVGAE